MRDASNSEILDQLDQDMSRGNYLMLDNGYYYAVLARMSVFQDGGRWAMVFDQLACGNHDDGHESIQIRTYAHGNSIAHPNGPFVNRSRPTKDGPEGPTFIETDEGAFLSPDARTFRFRGSLFAVSHDPKAYADCGINLQDSSRIEAYELMRLSACRYPNTLHASEDEVRSRLSVDIPMVLRLYGWQHPNFAIGETMSQSPSIRAVAEFLEAGATGPFTDPGVDNIHWNNWPAGGNL
jgi:hypothetical protein